MLILVGIEFLMRAIKLYLLHDIGSDSKFFLILIQDCLEFFSRFEMSAAELDLLLGALSTSREGRLSNEDRLTIL